jgi:hypothetical protein
MATDQALGKPRERVEIAAPSSVDDVANLSDEQLQALVLAGRQQRPALQAVPEPASEHVDVDGRVHVLPAADASVPEGAHAVDVHALLAVRMTACSSCASTACR